MRRSNVFTAALVALLTFVALSAFVGRRSWNRHRGWSGRCYYEDRYHDRRDNTNDNLRERHPATDSTFNN